MNSQDNFQVVNFLFPGCACHLMHLASSKAAKCLSNKVDDCIVDIFYYMAKSSKRKQEYKEYLKLCDLPLLKILKHVSTRWLSLGPCIERLTLQYDALKLYFQAEVSKLKKKPKQNKSTSSSKPVKRKAEADSMPKSKKAKLAGNTGVKVKSRSNSKHSESSRNTGVKVNSTSNSKHSDSSRNTGVKVNSTSNSKHSDSSRNTHDTGVKVNSSSNSKHSDSSRSNDKSKASVSSTKRHESGSVSDNAQRKESGSTSKQKTFDLNKFLFKQSELEKKEKSRKCDGTKGKATNGSTCSSKDQSSDSEEMTKNQKKLSRLEDPNTLLYCYFLSKTIPIFEKANAFLQKEEPCIHLLHRMLCEQFSDLTVRFVKPEVIARNDNIFDIDFSDRENQKCDNDIFIGNSARDYLKEKRSVCNEKQFFEDVRKYYSTACKYMLDMFPFGEEILMSAEFLDISQRSSTTFSQLEYFVDRFGVLSADERDKLEEEFQYFQIDKLTGEVLEAKRVDNAWGLIGKMRSPVTGNLKYGTLFKVAKYALVMYHSNADCERIFSIVKKTTTEFRSSLSTGTLDALLKRKMYMAATHSCCYRCTHTPELLKKCKSATSDSLKL